MSKDEKYPGPSVVGDFHFHNPVPHRDGKPPWCKHCGLTKDYVEPTSRFESR